MRKSEGRLYMMGTCMGWMTATADTFNVSHYYADIKSESNNSPSAFVTQNVKWNSKTFSSIQSKTSVNNFCI